MLKMPKSSLPMIGFRSIVGAQFATVVCNFADSSVINRRGSLSGTVTIGIRSSGNASSNVASCGPLLPSMIVFRTSSL